MEGPLRRAAAKGIPVNKMEADRLAACFQEVADNLWETSETLDEFRGKELQQRSQMMQDMSSVYAEYSKRTIE